MPETPVPAPLARNGLACVVALAVFAAAAQAENPELSPESQARDLADEVMRGAADGDLGAWTQGVIDRALQAENPELSPESQARDLADEVMRGAADGDLGAWTQGVIDRALERVGEAAADTARTAASAGNGDPLAPLPAERHAAGLRDGAGGRANGSEVLVFMSLSVPAASWRQWARDAAHMDAPLVLRGTGPEGFRAMVKDIGDRLGGHEAGVAIDPRLFRLFGVERVPAVVVVPGGVAPCRSRGCADPGSRSGAGFSAPPHDRVTGNIGLVAALEAVAAEGDAGRTAARRTLERLRGEDRRK